MQPILKRRLWSRKTANLKNQTKSLIGKKPSSSTLHDSSDSFDSWFASLPHPRKSHRAQFRNFRLGRRFRIQRHIEDIAAVELDLDILLRSRFFRRFDRQQVAVLLRLLPPPLRAKRLPTSAATENHGTVNAKFEVVLQLRQGGNLLGRHL